MVNQTGPPPTSQPEEGIIETANQKLPSMKNTMKSPDLERISSQNKALSRGYNQDPRPERATHVPAL